MYILSFFIKERGAWYSVSRIVQQAEKNKSIQELISTNREVKNIQVRKQ